MQKVLNLTEQTSSSTDTLFNQGGNLVQVTKTTLGKSVEGKESIEEMIKVIENLDVETKDTYKSITSLGEKLKEIGVKISLDDFGTGYSSLSYLKKLPIDTLKIDKSFVTDVTESEREVALTTAVINMGHNLKLQVLAEGVETKEQFDLLKDYNCDVVQGFYYSKPINAEAFEKLLKDGCFIQKEG
jgi:EAL domain-containing protein (putative c-di-GMP-specific phosphodiesterase class I)